MINSCVRPFCLFLSGKISINVCRQLSISIACTYTSNQHILSFPEHLQKLEMISIYISTTLIFTINFCILLPLKFNSFSSIYGLPCHYLSHHTFYQNQNLVTILHSNQTLVKHLRLNVHIQYRQIYFFPTITY